MMTNIEATATEPLLKIELEDGKYCVIQPQSGGLRALRYGKEWRDLTGDNLVAALAYEIDRLRNVITEFAQTDGSEKNVANTDILAKRIRYYARKALAQG